MTSRASAKRKPVLQRRASTCCSARCGGGGTAPSAGGHTRCGRAGRPRSRRRGRRRASAATSEESCRPHHEGMKGRAAGRGSRAPRFPRATACGAWTRPPQAHPASRSFCPRGHAAAARPSRAPPSAHAQSRAISATAPVADGVGQEGLRGQRRPHEPLEMASTCPSQPTVGAGVTTTGGAAPLHKVGITAHRKEQEAPSRGLATF